MTESIIYQVRDQLIDELGDIGRTVADALGLDPIEDVDMRLPRRCEALAAEMCGADDQVAAEAVMTVLWARWPQGAQPPHEWWRTPVGRIAAKTLGGDDVEAVSHSVAAAMLGVHRGTVAQLVSRGRLERHPDGGITRASVLARVAQET